MKKFALFLVIFSFLAGAAWGQDVYVFSSALATPNWELASNWTKNGVAVSTAPPVLTANDTLTIRCTNIWSTLNVSTPINCKDLFIEMRGWIDNADITVQNLTVTNTNVTQLRTNCDVTVTGTTELRGNFEVNVSSSLSIKSDLILTYLGSPYSNPGITYRGGTIKIDNQDFYDDPWLAFDDFPQVYEIIDTTPLKSINAGNRNVVILVKTNAIIGPINTTGTVRINVDSPYKATFSTINAGELIVNDTGFNYAISDTAYGGIYSSPTLFTISDFGTDGDVEINGDVTTGSYTNTYKNHNTLSPPDPDTVTLPPTSGNQTYAGTGTVTLSNGKRTLKSNGSATLGTGIIIANAPFTATSGVVIDGSASVILGPDCIINAGSAGVVELISTNSVLSPAINIAGTINDAYQLKARAPNGTVEIGGGVNIAAANTDNCGESAAIYVHANAFSATGSAGSIVPGGLGGQLCLNINTPITGGLPAIDDDIEDTNPPGTVIGARWHQHAISAISKHLVYSSDTDPGTIIAKDGVTILTSGTDYDFISVSSNNDTVLNVDSGNDIYLIDVDEQTIPRALTFTTSGTSAIIIRGTYNAPNVTLNPGTNGIILDGANITLGAGSSFDTTGTTVTMTTYNGSDNSVEAGSITLGAITGNSDSLTFISDTNIAANGAITATATNIKFQAVNNININAAFSAAKLAVVSTGSSGKVTFETGVSVTVTSADSSAHTEAGSAIFVSANSFDVRGSTGLVTVGAGGWVCLCNAGTTDINNTRLPLTLHCFDLTKKNLVFYDSDNLTGHSILEFQNNPAQYALIDVKGVTTTKSYTLGDGKNVYFINLGTSAPSAPYADIDFAGTSIIEFRGDCHFDVFDVPSIPTGTISFVLNNANLYFSGNAELSLALEVIGDNSINPTGNFEIDNISAAQLTGTGSLTINLNTGDEFIVGAASTFDIDGKLTVAGTGTTTLNKSITADGGMDFTGNVAVAATTVELTTTGEDVIFRNTITGGNNNLTINGNALFSGGTTANSIATLRINNGTYANSNTTQSIATNVIFDGATVTSSNTYNNVEILNTLTANGTLTVGNNLDVKSGTLAGGSTGTIAFWGGNVTEVTGSAVTITGFTGTGTGTLTAATSLLVGKTVIIETDDGTDPITINTNNIITSRFGPLYDGTDYHFKNLDLTLNGDREVTIDNAGYENRFRLLEISSGSDIILKSSIGAQNITIDGSLDVESNGLDLVNGVWEINGTFEQSNAENFISRTHIKANSQTFLSTMIINDDNMGANETIFDGDFTFDGPVYITRDTAVFLGDNNFNNSVICSNTYPSDYMGYANVILKFESGTTQTFDLSDSEVFNTQYGGTYTTTLTNNGGTGRWYIAGLTESQFITDEYTTISNCQSVNYLERKTSGSTYQRATDGTPANNFNVFTEAVLFTWTGATGTDWNVDTNWVGSSPGFIRPAAVVIIPEITAPAEYPILEDDVSVKTLTIEANAEIDLQNNALTVAEADGLTNDGTIKLQGNSATQVQVNGASVTGDDVKGTIQYSSGSTNWVFGDEYVNLIVDSGASMATAGALEVSGTASIGANITATSAHFEGETAIGADITTTGAGGQIYDVEVTITNTPTLTAAAGSTITFEDEIIDGETLTVVGNLDVSAATATGTIGTFWSTATLVITDTTVTITNFSGTGTPTRILYANRGVNTKIVNITTLNTATAISIDITAIEASRISASSTDTLNINLTLEANTTQSLTFTNGNIWENRLKHVIVSSGNINLSSNLYAESLTINSTLNAGGNSIDLCDGTWVNNGTFVHNLNTSLILSGIDFDNKNKAIDSSITVNVADTSNLTTFRGNTTFSGQFRVLKGEAIFLGNNTFKSAVNCNNDLPSPFPYDGNVELKFASGTTQIFESTFNTQNGTYTTLLTNNGGTGTWNIEGLTPGNFETNANTTIEYCVSEIFLDRNDVNIKIPRGDDTDARDGTTSYNLNVFDFVEIYRWTGAIDTLWDEPGNWSTPAAPDPTDDTTRIIILSSASRNPQLVEDIECFSLDIQAGKILTLGEHELAVHKPAGLTNAGTIRLHGTSLDQVNVNSARTTGDVVGGKISYYDTVGGGNYWTFGYNYADLEIESTAIMRNPTANLSVSGNTILGSNITTTGAITQTYGSTSTNTVTLTNNVVMQSANGLITINSNVIGAYNLTITSTNNYIEIKAPITVNTLSLNAGSGGTARAITQTAGSIITVNELTLSATGVITLARDNEVGTVRVIQCQSFDFKNTSELTISEINTIAYTPAVNRIVRIENTGNITVGGNITSATVGNRPYRVALIATGSVTVVPTAAIATTSTDNCSSETSHSETNASIYVEATSFTALAGTGTITPGTTLGHLCLQYIFDNSGVINVGASRVAGDRYHPQVVVPDKVPIIMYSFAEDAMPLPNSNGQIDRIRVQTNVVHNNDFSGFEVEVRNADGTRVNPSSINFASVSGHTDSFYINFEDNGGLYDGRAYSWTIIKNDSLEDAKNNKIGAAGESFRTINTIPPRIKYALALPEHNEIYVEFSQPVVFNSLGEDYGSVTLGGGAITGIRAVSTAPCPPYYLDFGRNLAAPPPSSGVTGYILTLAAPLTVAQLSAGTHTFYINNLVNMAVRAVDWNDSAVTSDFADYAPPKYPTNLTTYASYTAQSGNSHIVGGSADSASTALLPPYELFEKTYRITDVLISREPSSANDPGYFVWPVYAKVDDPRFAGYPDSTDPNLEFWGQSTVDHNVIWDFDGTRMLDMQSKFGLQARVNGALGTPTLYYANGLNIDSSFRNPPIGVQQNSASSSGGLWLPTGGVSTYIVPQFYPVPLTQQLPGSAPPLSIFDIDDANLLNGAVFEFFFKLPSPNLFIARLDAPRGSIPSDWYRRVRPFRFGITSVVRQSGGVTILNNVINSDNREITYLRYKLNRPGRVTIQVYTLDGVLVKNIMRNEQRAAGEWTAGWDGTNQSGRAVARGMYFIRVTAPDIDEIRKVLVIK